MNSARFGETESPLLFAKSLQGTSSRAIHKINHFCSSGSLWLIFLQDWTIEPLFIFRGVFNPHLLPSFRLGVPEGTFNSIKGFVFLHIFVIYTSVTDNLKR